MVNKDKLIAKQLPVDKEAIELLKEAYKEMKDIYADAETVDTSLLDKIKTFLKHTNG